MPQPTHHARDPGRSRTLTLLIASASSVVAALLVSKVWGPGTLVGAAATPIIVTLVGELLQRPAEKINVVRVTPSGRRVHERVEASEAPVGSRIAAQDEMAPASVHRTRGRRPLAVALATGLVAFVIGAIVLSSTELVFGGKLGSGGGTTTYFRGGGHPTGTTSAPKPATKKATPATTTTTTTTVPAPAAPPATTQTVAPTTPTTPTTPPPPAGTTGPPGGATGP